MHLDGVELGEIGLDRPLRPLGLSLQRPVDVPAPRVLILHLVSRAQVGLVRQVDDEGRLLSVRRVTHDAAFDLVRVGRADRPTGPPEQHGEADEENRQRSD